MRLRIYAAGAMLAAVGTLTAQEKPIDTERSSITIHVGKAGLLSGAAHEHWVNAPIASGVVDESAARVEFKVESAKLTVKPDAKVDEKTRGEIQKDMEEMVLQPAKFPAIEFRSTRVEKSAGGQFKVDGTLTLHGVSKPVSVNVKRDGDAYAGHTEIKQTEFGIKPISLGAGVIRVKDQLEIDFRVFAR